MIARRIILTLIFILSCNLGFSQVHPTEDARPLYTANVILISDATYTTSQMILERLSADQLNSPGITNEYATSQIASAIAGQVATEAAKKFAYSLYTFSQSYYLGYLSIAYSVVDVCLTFASSSNAQSRDYFIFTPADALYALNISIPGDIDKPCSMIKVFSIDSNGVATQKYNEEIVTSSSMNFDRRISLPKGLCRINISLGSGSVKFHTAGTLNQAMLDNPTTVSWVVSGAPATVGSFNMLNYLPNVGDSVDITLPYSPAPRPSNMLNGSVTYANIRTMPAILPPDMTNADLRIDIYGEPTEEQLALLGSWPQLNLKVATVGDPVMTSNGGVWRFTRLPDYTTRTMYRGIYHPY